LQEEGLIEEAERISEENVVEMVAASVWKEVRTWKEDSVGLSNLQRRLATIADRGCGEGEGKRDVYK
jgi:hypothetical protein